MNVVVVSMDTTSRARKARNDWNIGNARLGSNRDLESANAWGLYLSKGVKEGEPDLCSEPDLFLVRPDGRLYYFAINCAPGGGHTFRRFGKPSTTSSPTATRRAANTVRGIGTTYGGAGDLWILVRYRNP